MDDRLYMFISLEQETRSERVETCATTRRRTSGLFAEAISFANNPG
jgi:hypothetical protein